MGRHRRIGYCRYRNPFTFASAAKLQPWSGRYTKHDVFRAIMCMTYHAFFIDEALQVNGVVVFDDLSGMTLKHQTAFTIEEQRSFFGGWHVSNHANYRLLPGLFCEGTRRYGVPVPFSREETICLMYNVNEYSICVPVPFLAAM